MPNTAFSFEWKLTGPPDAEGFLVAFAWTRTQLLDVRLIGLEVDLSLTRFDESHFFGMKKDYPARAQSLRVTYAGDAPHIAFLAWIHAGAADGENKEYDFALPREVHGLYEGLGAAVKELKEGRAILELLRSLSCRTKVPGTRLSPAEVEGYLELGSTKTTKPEELFRKRLQAIQWHARAQEFFLRMDLETRYELATERWRGILMRVGSLLGGRLEARARLGHQGRVPIFGQIDVNWTLGTRDWDDLQAASAFLGHHILSLETYDGEALVAWAFEMFATDRLAVHHIDFSTHRLLKGHGAANGLLFLQFGEFALFCIDNGVDASLWSRHLGALVHATHAFLETALDSVTLPGKAPPPQHFEFGEGRFHRRERLEELRCERNRAAAIAMKVPLVFLQDRFTSLVAQAYPEYNGQGGAMIRDSRPLTKGHEAKLKPRGC